MDKTTLEILEFPAVLGEIASFSLTAPGRAAVLALRPLSGLAEIEDAFAEFLEVREAVKAEGTLPLGSVSDIAPLFKRLSTAGAYLLPEDLLLVIGNLSASKSLRALLSPDFTRRHPRTSAMVEALSDQRALSRSLGRILDDKGDIKDDASGELLRIRRSIRSSRDRARGILEGLTTDRTMQEEYLQEDFITIRDDRFVLCIKAGMHSAFDGVVHGRSGSGGAYFIEPMQLVELNNKVAVLKKEEKAEEIAILRAASAEIFDQREPLAADLAVFGRLDGLQARALFAGHTGSNAPVVRKNGRVRLKNARHPLLILKEKSGGSAVVPVDVIMPEGCSVLVISGANTGGKTVALKTLGLLTLMALSGVPVPAEEGSEAALFTGVFADIGDRQDIIASLSTFSAHIKRMREFLSSPLDGSLVLIDEIGAGTDPAEGGAFALAALETLRERGATAVVTTHLNALKAHAQTHPAYRNASVEFDEASWKPLYQLRYGVPGPSLGLSIAESLGIPKQVIERARKNLDEKEGAFIESIRLLEEARTETAALKVRLTELERLRDEAVRKLRSDRAAILEKSRSKAEKMIAVAKEDLKGLMERLKQNRPSTGIGPGKAAIEIEKSRARLLADLGQKPSAYRPAIGDRVSLSGGSTKGSVVNVDAEGKRAELSVGGLKVWAPWNKLKKIGGNGRIKPAEAAADIPVSTGGMEPASSVNIIGLRAEEAMTVVTRFIDNAFAAGLSRVEIIHGMGTGRLASVVGELLKKDPRVAALSHGDPSFGGAGVTVVEFK